LGETLHPLSKLPKGHNFSLSLKLLANLLFFCFPGLFEVEQGGLEVMGVCFCCKMKSNLLLDALVELFIVWMAPLAWVLATRFSCPLHFPYPLFQAHFHFVELQT
jgi:hypothetical protein